MGWLMGEGIQTSQASPPAGLGRNEPYCSNCGYVLKGLTDSSKCPECGKPMELADFPERYLTLFKA